ncbi:MAG: MerR family transcriptional regulator [Pyrinomonadaceae bacterium]
MAEADLQIGEVAAQSGVSIDAVRYYERRRLLPRAQRSGGGFRLFRPEAVERIRFIKQAQDFGFSLQEISALLTTGGGDSECRNVRDVLRTKLMEIDGRLKSMRNFRRLLADGLAECETELNKRGEDAKCPVMVGITSDTARNVKR